MKFAPGQVIEAFDLKGKRVVFRTIQQEDLEAALYHTNLLVAEKAYISYQRPLTKEEETEWLQVRLKGVEQGRLIIIVVEVDTQFSGVAEVFRHRAEAWTHRVGLGIALSKNRGLGIGYRLMQTMERLAKTYFHATIMDLTVHQANTPARRLYEKCGFEECGRIKGGINHYGEFSDEIRMVKYLLKKKNGGFR